MHSNMRLQMTALRVHLITSAEIAFMYFAFFKIFIIEIIRLVTAGRSFTVQCFVCLQSRKMDEIDEIGID